MTSRRSSARRGKHRRADWLSLAAASVALALVGGCSTTSPLAGPADEFVEPLWGPSMWFAANAGTRQDFLTDELDPLLGQPGMRLGDSGPLRIDGEGVASYINPLGELVPVLIRGPDGPWTQPLDELPNAPLIIALHQTNTDGGAEPCGDQAPEELAYGTYFADLGNISMCPTLSFTGARQPENRWDTTAFYADYPSWSAMGKDIAEVSWLLDALTSARILVDDVTVIGHSQGAIYGLYAAAVDERIDRVIANAGFVSTSDDPDPGRWTRTEWYRAFRSYPAGFDFLEVVAAISPRCALLINYDQDTTLGVTVPSSDLLVDFERRFPTIDWLTANGVHSWPDAQLVSAAEWLAAHDDGCI